MKKAVARMAAQVLILLLCLSPLTALASNFYIVPDSDKRYLTEVELWEWQYDALGYIFNEIFARHGYHFIPGEKYDNYFRSQLWYAPNQTYATNQQIYDKLMTAIDWHNEALIKDVRAQMRAMKTTNPGGKPLPKVAFEPPIPGAFSSFFDGKFASGQRLPVYSGPGDWYNRAADGKAQVSTNGHVYVGGNEDGWLMVMYWTNNGHVRVGYVNTATVKGAVYASPLHFTYETATVLQKCSLTDDPVASYQPLLTLYEGQKVTYLSEYINEQHWVYIETVLGNKPVRGFVPAGCVVRDNFEMDGNG